MEDWSLPNIVRKAIGPIDLHDTKEMPIIKDSHQYKEEIKHLKIQKILEDNQSAKTKRKHLVSVLGTNHISRVLMKYKLVQAIYKQNKDDYAEKIKDQTEIILFIES